MRKADVRRLLRTVHLPKGWHIYIGEPWDNYFVESDGSLACTFHANKAIYINPNAVKYLNKACMKTLVRHEVAHMRQVGHESQPHAKDWYERLLKTGSSYKAEFELAQYYNRKTHNRTFKSFRAFLNFYSKNHGYYKPETI